MYRTYFLLVMVVCGLTVLAQQVQTVTLATPFTFSMKQVAGKAPPVAGEMFGNFEILKVAPSPNGFELLIVGYDTGMFKLPGSSGMVSISVLVPPVDSIKNYAPPKEPFFERIEAKSRFWIPLLGAVVVLLMIFLYWFFKRKKPAPAPFAVQTPGGMGLLQEVKEGWLAGKLNSLQLGEGLVNSLLG